MSGLIVKARHGKQSFGEIQWMFLISLSWDLHSCVGCNRTSWSVQCVTVVWVFVSYLCLLHGHHKWVYKAATAIWGVIGVRTHRVQLTMSTCMYSFCCISSYFACRWSKWTWNSNASVATHLWAFFPHSSPFTTSLVCWLLALSPLPPSVHPLSF